MKFTKLQKTILIKGIRIVICRAKKIIKIVNSWSKGIFQNLLFKKGNNQNEN